MDRDELLIKKVDVSTTTDTTETGDAETGAAVGGVGGAAAGAVAGSLLGPVGAAIGAAVGAVVGAGASGAAVAAVDTIDNDDTVTGIDAVENRAYVEDDVVVDNAQTAVYGKNEVDAYANRLDAEIEQREAEMAQHLTDEERVRTSKGLP